ncbi:unnamed protein product [Penicillium salamii]|uniref:Uncharacterized protein n=1 Tax=Penicillium salamii TaxID=1612424 RepID=A0A9W4NIW3_9EURO|nr:unnamed protein product [Penicillium salamii]CAG8191543.1 unnamed protein product [Penicillium salamii]CAG8284762.1 unnamed protein product [Penicillium salamii]CAG8296665.1 unnamed protein product [Penicillium salamii]CAG8374809.1 unnamed protein product [Penicillium salamii]
MGDAIRPSDDEFDQILRKSLGQWSSYLDLAKEFPFFPSGSFDPRETLGPIPHFLGQGSLPPNTSYACEERSLQGANGSLFINGQSIWRTSNGECTLDPRVLPKQLLLAVQNSMKVEFPESQLPSDRHCLDGGYFNDDEKHISVLFLAWAYILSARWSELLSRSSEHPCQVEFIPKFPNNTQEVPTGSDRQATIEVDVGDEIDEAEAFWWNAILRCDSGWNISSLHRHNVYLSPWSVSICGKSGFSITGKLSMEKGKLPSSATALEYISRFCIRHDLYDQCSASLSAALYIPQLRNKPLAFPLSTHNLLFNPPQRGASIAALIKEYKEVLPHLMTLSSNAWGIRSTLHSAFFNPEIPCHLVSPWLNPAFAIIDPILKQNDFSTLAKLLALRNPRLGSLWLGAILTGLAASFLRGVRAGCTAMDIHAAGWTDTTQTFLTCKLGVSNGESISREDEGRLLFITNCDEYHSRVPIEPWKPFGETPTCDTEIEVREHVQCGSHCLEYEGWNWLLTDADPILDLGLENHRPSVEDRSENCQVDALAQSHSLDYEVSSQLYSELATRGIFGWLRSTGYLLNEKPLYEHSWIDLESSEEELDDKDSDIAEINCSKSNSVEKWLDNLE